MTNISMTNISMTVIKIFALKNFKINTHQNVLMFSIPLTCEGAGQQSVEAVLLVPPRLVEQAAEGRVDDGDGAEGVGGARYSLGYVVDQPVEKKNINFKNNFPTVELCKTKSNLHSFQQPQFNSFRGRLLVSASCPGFRPPWMKRRVNMKKW